MIDNERLDDLEKITRSGDWSVCDEDILRLIAEVRRLREFEALARETGIFK